MKKSAAALILMSAFMSVVPLVASATFVNWSRVKECPDGYVLMRGDSWAPGGAPQVFFQANLSGHALSSLESQLAGKLASQVSLKSSRWGQFSGNVQLEQRLSDLFLELQITEYGSDRVVLELFQQGRRVADYQFTGCR